MIAATGSGCGKTTITCGLLKALLNKGLNTKSYKCGPDYIDPMFHKAVLGIESENLDLFLSTREEINEIFYGNDSKEVQVVEGVMGLFDGINSLSNEGSSYDLACKLDIPVVLVVNAHGMGRSLLAIIRGFKAMDEDNRIKAVILNQISPMYFDTIVQVIEEELGITVLGYFPKLTDCSLESRYLGLKMPNEIEKLENDIAKAAGIIADTINIEKLLEISKVDENAVKSRLEGGYGCNDWHGQCGRCSEFDECDECGERNKCSEFNKSGECNKSGEFKDEVVCSDNNKEPFSKIRIGIARDEAFCFVYEANLRLLRKLGAELVEFSPMRDTKLPDNIDGLILGGGYPELHAQVLSDNAAMRSKLKQAIDSGLPSLAECGGFMYLHDSICVEGQNYPMVGAIEGNCSKKDKLVRFGYLTIYEKSGSFIDGKYLLREGDEGLNGIDAPNCNDKTACDNGIKGHEELKGNYGIKGHEFHYYDSTNNGADAVSQKPNGNRSWEAAHITDNHWWGFAHLYYPSNIAFAKSFVDKCKKWRDGHE